MIIPKPCQQSNKHCCLQLNLQFKRNSTDVACKSARQQKCTYFVHYWPHNTRFGPSGQKCHCNALLLQHSRFELIRSNEQDFSASLFSMTQKNSSQQLEIILTSSFPESPRQEVVKSAIYRNTSFLKRFIFLFFFICFSLLIATG